MAILEVLSRSQRLCEKRSVVILMYPPHLKDSRQTRSENHDVPRFGGKKPPHPSTS